MFAFLLGAIAGATGMWLIVTQPRVTPNNALSEAWLKMNQYERGKKETIWH
jgi:hypothetical protein